MTDQNSSSPTPFGPGNPHPLSQLQTELVWEGNYGEYGDRRGVDAAGLAMPMQRIETIDEPRARAEAQGDLFDTQKAHLDDFRNQLIWGDNKLVLASLIKKFKGSIDLIYIDPPFDVGADFTMSVPIGDQQEAVADPRFVPVFAEAKARVRAMDYRFARIDSSVLSTVFEVYAAVVLGTEGDFNLFETH